MLDKAIITPGENLPYICSETRLTVYGNDKASTDSWLRLSHHPCSAGQFRRKSNINHRTPA